MFRHECLLCRSTTLIEVIDLGMHPMADTFIPASRLSEADRLYPLIVDLCERCGQLQLRTVTKPSERYAEVDYSYTSSNSPTSRRHWTEYCEEISRETGLNAGDVVVEVGSNDGFLCAEFQKRGARVLGVDPSPAMAELARARGVNTFTALFETCTVDEAARRLPARPRLIAANNVFNHSNDPLDFATAVSRLLADDGTFVFELPYWGNLVEQGTFDQIYHEHVTYFTLTYAVNLFRAVGMAVVGVEIVDYHGGSLRVFVRHKTEPSALSTRLAGMVETLLARENANGLFREDTYTAFRRGVRRRRDLFLERLYHLVNEDRAVACIGAAAKGNTFLNYYELGAGTVACVTDASEHKIGKYTPGTRIPITSDAVLARYDRLCAIVTSWNIAGALRENLAIINPRIEYLNPYGDKEAS
jgi:SAM-dependent methyltransferase